MKYIGYTIMVYKNGYALPIIENDLKFELRKGNIINIPFKGIFISTTENYYRLSGNKVLITLEFSDEDIIAGNPNERDCEIRIRQGIIKNFKIMQIAKFKITAKEKQFILKNRLHSSIFNIGDWIKQERTDVTTYALILEILKNKNYKGIVIGTDRKIPAIISIKNWYPEPIKINENEVPEKLKLKVLKKKGNM